MHDEPIRDEPLRYGEKKRAQNEKIKIQKEKTLAEPGAERLRWIGIVYALAAFIVWGFLPLYWKQLTNVDALEILAHRFIWSFVFVALLLGWRGGFPEVRKTLSVPRSRYVLMLAAVLIAINWGVYIWAVNHDHLIDASLGYYMNPLVSVALGMIVLGERLGKLQKSAILLATLAVLLLALELHKIPWIALTLAFSFGFYGLAKKMLHIDAATGLFVETMYIVPLALSYLLYREVRANWPLLELPWWQIAMLIGAGIVTALPLLWFAEAANRIPLSTVGIIQYLTPTMKLIFGVLLFHEPFTWMHGVSFALIWLALGMYTVELIRGSRKRSMLPVSGTDASDPDPLAEIGTIRDH
ncbi:MAG: EamA family transporter RarD [Candidatus Carbobacillus altaicus]|nr:EamA family transporter RarD [Candidatus Carbobacillus altaicus]